MEFDSPDVMKDFPGLYASESNKKCNIDSDYSDDAEKTMKKDILIGKRKEKKDKKDKERGYAALEGESSADENCKSRSPSKSKKTKSFKFTSKSKEKREKSREKENSEKKKERDKKSDKKGDKDKGKKLKSVDDTVDIAEALPIFGTSLDVAIDRSKCHDGVDLPLPIRECIDYLETTGIAFENVYKISGTKSKVLQIKKMYNHRQVVNLNDYDVPTATSLVKMYLRDLPEPIFTNDLLIRFEEAGAILNLNTREKHLKILVDNLPPHNKLLLSWLVIHLDNITLNEKHNKMNRQNLSVALNHTFHCSSRLLQALLHHSRSLFPDVVITRYLPPLSSGSQLPEEPNLMEIELEKQESLLTQIHKEMNVGCISKQREELLWEVQRIITQLKRKLKTVYKDKEVVVEKVEAPITIERPVHQPIEQVIIEPKVLETVPLIIPEQKIVTPIEEIYDIPLPLEAIDDHLIEENVEKTKEIAAIFDEPTTTPDLTEILSDSNITLMQLKNDHLYLLKESLLKNIEAERNEIANLKCQFNSNSDVPSSIKVGNPDCLTEVMDLLYKENQILQIKKINLVRKIVEQQELCIELKAKLQLSLS